AVRAAVSPYRAGVRVGRWPTAPPGLGGTGVWSADGSAPINVDVPVGEPLDGLDPVPQSLVDLEVEVRPAGVTGRALQGDDVAGLHRVTHGDGGLRRVGVVGDVAVAVVDHHRDAVSGDTPAGVDDRAGPDRPDRRARRRRLVHAAVQHAPPRA